MSQIASSMERHEVPWIGWYRTIGRLMSTGASEGLNTTVRLWPQEASSRLKLPARTAMYRSARVTKDVSVWGVRHSTFRYTAPRVKVNPDQGHGHAPRRRWPNAARLAVHPDAQTNTAPATEAGRSQRRWMTAVVV